MKKKCIGWARVSSREQEQEGFSLAVQEEGFGRWEKLHNAVVDPLFIVAETASKAEERKKFKEMLAFARRHADEYYAYRCSKYRSVGHPRIRLTEADLDQQIVEALEPLERVCAGTRQVIEAMSRSMLEVSLQDGDVQVSETKRLLSLLDTQRDNLLRKNLAEAIPDDMYDRQMAQFAEQESGLRQSLIRHERAQTKIEMLVEQSSDVLSMVSTDWLQMERRARQLALSALFGGFRLEGRTLIPENRTRVELFRPS